MAMTHNDKTNYREENIILMTQNKRLAEEDYSQGERLMEGVDLFVTASKPD